MNFLSLTAAVLEITGLKVNNLAICHMLVFLPLLTKKAPVSQPDCRTNICIIVKVYLLVKQTELYIDFDDLLFFAGKSIPWTARCFLFGYRHVSSTSDTVSSRQLSVKLLKTLDRSTLIMLASTLVTSTLIGFCGQASSRLESCTNGRESTIYMRPFFCAN